MDKNLENKVFKIISDSLGIVQNEVRLDSKIEELSQDSIQLFGLIMAFENEFQSKVQYEDLMKIETVGDIIGYIKDKNLTPN